MANPFTAIQQVATALHNDCQVPVYCDSDGFEVRAEQTRIVIVPHTIDLRPPKTMSRSPRTAHSAPITWIVAIFAPSRDYARVWDLLERAVYTIRRECPIGQYELGSGEFDPESLAKDSRSVKLVFTLTVHVALEDPTPVQRVPILAVDGSVTVG